MASTYSPTLRLELIGNGEQAGTWGTTTNTNLGSLLEQAITGVQTITMGDATYTLSSFDGAVDEARNAVLVLGGTVTTPQNLIAPAVEKTYIIKNGTGANVTIKTSGGNGVTFVNNQVGIVYCDGTNFFQAVNVNSITGNVAVTGNLSATGNVSANNATFTGTVTAGTFSGITGRVVQIVSNVTSNSAETTSTSYVSANHSVSITPTSANSKILVMQTGTLAQPGDGGPSWNAIATIYRDSTNLAGSNNSFAGQNTGYSGSIYSTIAMSYLDTPSTTNSVTYTVYIKNITGGSALYNWGFSAGRSVITAMEIL
jgi:hypothetical protein